MGWLQRLMGWTAGRREVITGALPAAPAVAAPAAPGAVEVPTQPPGAETPPAPAPAAAADVAAGYAPGTLDMLIAFEGLKEEPYLCPAGKPTIGIGSTRYPDGRRVTMADPPITRERAVEMALHDLNEAGEDVDEATEGVSLSLYQRTALCLFTQNLGPGALFDSTLLRLLKLGDVDGAALQFDVWNKARDKTTRRLVALRGLSKRRRAERYLFQGRSPMQALRQAERDFEGGPRQTSM